MADGDEDAQYAGSHGPSRGRRGGGTVLRAVDGPLGDPDPPPTVRLRREFKGLTVADLSRDHVARRLPGQVRSALQHLERGAFAAAERALPAAVLRGPGHGRRGARRALLLTLLALAVLFVASWLWP